MTPEEEWQKILNEPGELKRRRDELKRDLFNAMFVFAYAASRSFNVKRLVSIHARVERATLTAVITP